MDPVLRLYRGCPVMLPCNKNVKLGQANGTQAIFKRVVLKAGEQPKQVLLEGKIPLKAVRANQIAHIELEHCNEYIQPSTFSMRPQQLTFKAKVPKPHSLQRRPDKLYLSTVQPRATNCRGVELIEYSFTTGAMFRTGYMSCFHA